LAKKHPAWRRRPPTPEGAPAPSAPVSTSVPVPRLVDDCTLQLEAGMRIVTDKERQLTTGTEAVADT
jgi:hypothetical protein